jgi:hypothetical protein
MTLTALPPSVMGRLIESPAWSPEAAPPSPLVSAAFAAPTPARESPPRMTVNHSPLDTILFMRFYSLIELVMRLRRAKAPARMGGVLPKLAEFTRSIRG